MIENLLLGAVGSVLGTFAFLFLNSYWKSLVLPKLEDMVYKGVRIEGKWSFEKRFNKEEKQVYTLEIIQRADKLKGTLTLLSELSEGTDVTSNAFTGYIADGFVIGSARPNTPDSIWHTTYCLKVIERLESISLRGVIAGIDLMENQITHWDVDFKKANG